MQYICIYMSSDHLQFVKYKNTFNRPILYIDVVIITSETWVRWHMGTILTKLYLNSKNILSQSSSYANVWFL